MGRPKRLEFDLQRGFIRSVAANQQRFRPQLLIEKAMQLAG
jgi:hypothetical protein